MNLQKKLHRSKKQHIEFIGLKKYIHKERSEIIKKLIVPAIKRELGKNLIAIAANGSYARNEDADFSDIELMIFVKDRTQLPRGFGKIIDGILIEGLFVTEDEYYQNTLDVNEEWYLAGSDRLKAITNAPFIQKVRHYKVKHLREKCFKHAHKMLYEVQESFGKLFTAINKGNKENLFPIVADAVMQVLKLMAYLNETPYRTLGSFITQAKGFSMKPVGFDEFMTIIINGRYLDLKLLEKRSTKLFAGIEQLFVKKMGSDIYDSHLMHITKE
jgi:predicted nucleotidyltransferase